MKHTSVITAFVVGLAALSAAPGARAQEVDHGAWDRLLRAYVNAAGQVNYPGVKTQRSVLDGYLASVATAKPGQVPGKSSQLAFWINAYNACVFKQVLDNYPVKSVKDIKGFFDKTKFQVGGESLTLNEIEGKARALGDWRSHMGVVCASTSCPFLRNEAYVPEGVDAQLAEQARKFLKDPARGLKVDAATGTLWVSKIFKWYAKDFVPTGSITPESLRPVIGQYLEPAVLEAIKGSKLTVKFMEYDWSLNVQPGV